MGPFSTLTELAGANIGPGDVGHSAFVEATDSWYEALLEGRGLDKWEVRKTGGAAVLASASGRMRAYTRVFDHADVDVAVGETSVSIDLGAALPAGSIVLAVIADVTEDFTDGSTGAFAADVGVSGGDTDLFTPTELNIDGGIALLTQNVAIPAGGVQLAVTITGDVDLDTLTAGSMSLSVLFTVPATTTIEAPEAEE